MANGVHIKNMKQYGANKLLKLQLFVALCFPFLIKIALGQTFVWTQTSAINATWTGIASSSDGTKLAACCNYPVIGVYISTNTGLTWAKVPTPTTINPWNYQDLTCIASSANGNDLVVGSGNYTDSTTNSGYIYYSGASGIANSWLQASEPGQSFTYLWADWSSIASSSDGTKVIAAGHYPIAISTNFEAYGATWLIAPIAPNPRGGWKTVACSSNGEKIVATDEIQIYTSTNSGNTWHLTTAPSNQWTAIASSSDGTKLVACNDYSIGRIYTSTNSGLNWIQTSAPSNTFWSAVTSSSDGTQLAASSYSGNIYFSTNSGSAWTTTSFSPYIRTMAASADGMKLFAALDGGGIYLGQLVVPARNFSASMTNFGVILQFKGATNCSYILLATANLDSPVVWQPIVTNSTDANGRWTFIDTNRSQYAQRFYEATQ